MTSTCRAVCFVRHATIRTCMLIMQGWWRAVEGRREGRERLQKVAALVMLDNMSAAPAAQRLPQTPAAALALGVLASWRSHCQVRSLQSFMVSLVMAPAPCKGIMQRGCREVPHHSQHARLQADLLTSSGLTLSAVMTHLVQSLMGT